MVGATGFEPKIKLERPLPQREQYRPKPGQNQAMGREMGAGAEQVGADPESPKTITGYITASITGNGDFPAHLQTVIQSWPNLSKKLQAEIIEKIKAGK